MLYKSGQISSKKTNPDYSKLYWTIPRRQTKVRYKCIRYFIDLQNCITTVTYGHSIERFSTTVDSKLMEYYSIYYACPKLTKIPALQNLFQTLTIKSNWRNYHSNSKSRCSYLWSRSPFSFESKSIKNYHVSTQK